MVTGSYWICLKFGRPNCVKTAFSLGQKTLLKRTLYLKLTPLGPVSADESLKLFGYRYNKNNENKLLGEEVGSF